MSLLNRFRVSQGNTPAPVPVHPRNGRSDNSPLHAPATSSGARASDASRDGRFSNGLKEFLAQVDGIGRGRLVDLGQAWQATLGFFIERGFKVYSEDLLTAWRNFLNEEEAQAKLAVAKAEPVDRSVSALAERFLEVNLNHAPDTLDAVLLWDLLDYLDRDAAVRVVARLTSQVRDGGAVLAIFHTRTPDAFCRYRVLDATNLELVPTPSLFPAQRVYNNREIQDLFRRFRSSKTFVTRDQLRENVFVKVIPAYPPVFQSHIWRITSRW